MLLDIHRYIVDIMSLEKNVIKWYREPGVHMVRYAALERKKDQCPVFEMLNNTK